MHKKRRLRTLGLLMGISFLMLAGFMLRWLYLQYGEEKLALNYKLKTLFDQKMAFYFDEAFKSKYLLARNLSDSMLSAGDSLLVINDSVTVAALTDAHTWPAAQHVNKMRTAKSTILMRHEMSINQDSASVKSHTNQKTEMRIDVLPDGAVSKSTFISDSFSNPEEGVIKSGIIKILSGLERDVLQLTVDTMAFKKDLEKLMSRLYPGITYQLHTIPPGDMLIVPAPKNQSFFSFSVGKYQWFIFKSLLPQIGFCIALLGLCSIAFLLSYTTVRRQIQLTEQKNDFISNMSHELKTPLTTAQLALEAFTHFDISTDPQKTKEYLQIATWEMKRLEMLVDNVLNNARLEESRIAFQKETLSLYAVLAQLMQQLQSAGKELHKCLIFESSSTILPFFGDKLHLQGALYNIVDNAIKYGRKSIMVSLTENNTHILITVTDDGPGIPAAYRTKIFDKFFRVPNGNEHLIKGHGLGLHYARYVIEQHGGKINVTDAAGQGSVFYVALPKYIPHEH
ncbi:MAG TPA: HAMP domain-containing sensor histidine kinase [Chitinophagaceae bacterium]|nr:HAMP domain-containing sensor histidine kinase [Chitinophagaceae bacterium]